METQTLNYNDRNYGNGPSQSNSNKRESSNQSRDHAEDSARQGLNIDHGFIQEIEAYQGLMLDFETEYADFLSSELPKCPTTNTPQDCEFEPSVETNRGRRSSNGGGSRRSSSVTNSRSSFDGTNGSNGGIRYNFDGTISCCDISYDLLVCIMISILTHWHKYNLILLSKQVSSNELFFKNA